MRSWTSLDVCNESHDDTTYSIIHLHIGDSEDCRWERQKGIHYNIQCSVRGFASSGVTRLRPKLDDVKWCCVVILFALIRAITPADFAADPPLLAEPFLTETVDCPPRLSRSFLARSHHPNRFRDVLLPEKVIFHTRSIRVISLWRPHGLHHSIQPDKSRTKCCSIPMKSLRLLMQHGG